MSRVLKVMVLLVALSLVFAVSVKPTTAFAGEHPVLQNGAVADNQGPVVADVNGEPGEGGEGDPDDGCDNLGVRAGDSFRAGCMGNLLGGEDPEMTLMEFVDLMLLQFMLRF